MTRSRRRLHLHWWMEVLIVLAFYGLYTGVRDIHGNHMDAIKRATTNAHRIIDLERSLHVFHEQAIQSVFIHHIDFMKVWNVFYGTAHWLAVGAVLIFLYVRMPQRYRVWRNTLAVCTALALVGFAFFPLLPPRLLPGSFHFVDSIDVLGGGFFSLKSDAVSDVSNLYAAMPSLHTAWSTWCALAMWPTIKRRALRPLLLLYPLATVFCIVITANHYFADAAGGLLTLGIAYLVARPLTFRWEQWRLRRALDRHPHPIEA